MSLHCNRLIILILCLFSWQVTQAGTTDSCRVVLNKKCEKSYQEGIAHFKKGNYPLALVAMKSVTGSEPACVDAWFVMGMIHFKRTESNFSEARRCFLKVIELCPTYDVYAWFYLAEIYFGEEEFSKALPCLDEFLKDVDKIKRDEDYNRAVELQRYARFHTEITSNPVPFSPRVVQGISTPSNEYLPILSPDNQVALFTREVHMPVDKNSLVQTPRLKERFMFSQREPDGTFTLGEEMPDPFNIFDNEGGATLTADNLTLYYTVCQYDKVKRYLNCDIYLSENQAGSWSPIQVVSKKVNRPDSWESQPSVSADGNTLYFVSDRAGGLGGYDIYMVTKDGHGDWNAPVNLGPDINSAGNEKSPFIHPDGKSLYYSTDGRPGLGGYDIYFARSDSLNRLGKARNIGYPINSADDEVGFFVSTDGRYGYFASNKLQGKGGWDLYSFELYEGARPEKILFIKGTVKSESNAEPVKAHIELTNLETRKISAIPLDTNTGNYVAVTPFNSDFIMTVKQEGHVYESKYIAKADSTFGLPATVDVEMKPIELNKSYRINDIFFPFNSFDLTPESKAVLEQLIIFLEENPAISIEIQGHTDNIGNDASNLKLSANRARSVYAYLIEKGISEQRLTFKGCGETMPVSTNDTEEGRAKNRRTVFVITRR